MLPRDMPFGGGKPPNYHLGAEVYHPNFCARQLGCPQLIPLKSYRSCNRATSWRDSDDLDVHKDCRCWVNKINNSVVALYPSWEPNSCSSSEFDAWWKARFAGLPDASTAVKTLFDSWDLGTVLAEPEARKFLVQMVKGINAQVIEDPSMTRNLGGQSIQARGKNKRKEVTQARDSALQPDPQVENSPSSSKAKRSRKKVVEEREEPSAVLIETTETDEELREAFEAVEAGRSAAASAPDIEAEHSAAASAGPVAEVQTAGVVAVVTSPLKPPIVAMPIHSIPSSPATASFAGPELAEFEAMYLDAQLDRLEQLFSNPSKAKSRAVDEAVDRVRIWQSTELDLDEGGEAIDQLMQDLDLLHKQNVAPRPILEISLGLARDVLNLHNCYEDLKPLFKASEFCQATHEANLADYKKQKAELDTMVADYKETKTDADKLEKHI
ncbi:unnamed protein product [Prunus armeniaca]